MVFYQETQKGGASTLIAQISGLVDRARSAYCTGVRSPESRHKQVALGLSSFIESDLFPYYLLSYRALPRCSSPRANIYCPVPRPGRCYRYQVYGNFAKRAKCVSRQTPIQPYFAFVGTCCETPSNMS